jgi:hypothetical protein
MSFEGKTADKKLIYIYFIVILDVKNNEYSFNIKRFDTVFRLLLIDVTFVKGLNFKLKFSEYIKVKSLNELYIYKIKNQYLNVLIKLSRRKKKKILTIFYGISDIDIALYRVIINNKIIEKWVSSE